VIVLRIAKDRAKDFERLFEAEQYPNWKRYHERKLFIAASLTRVEFGSESDDAKKAGYINYVVVAKLTDMRAHEAHDADPAFKAYDEKAEEFQPEGPSVYGGTTIFEI
jgi:hypothetical protein